MSEYSTGDVTCTDSCAVRVYVNEPTLRGYFFTRDDSSVSFINRTADKDKRGVAKIDTEPVVCTLLDIARVIRETHGKEIREEC